MAKGTAATIRLYMFLVFSDLMCDAFLSIRILFLAYMVMCTEMITTWVSEFGLHRRNDSIWSCCIAFVSIDGSKGYYCLPFA